MAYVDYHLSWDNPASHGWLVAAGLLLFVVLFVVCLLLLFCGAGSSSWRPCGNFLNTSENKNKTTTIIRADFGIKKLGFGQVSISMFFLLFFFFFLLLLLLSSSSFFLLLTQTKERNRACLLALQHFVLIMHVQDVLCKNISIWKRKQRKARWRVIQIQLDCDVLNRLPW